MKPVCKYINDAISIQKMDSVEKIQEKVKQEKEIVHGDYESRGKRYTSFNNIKYGCI